MNKFTENECLLNFELKFKSLENLSKPPTRKITRKCIVEKTKWQRRGKKAKRQILPRKTKQASRKKTNRYQCRKESKHPFRKNQTIVTYKGYELVSFKDNIVSKNTKKRTSTSVRRLQSWFKEKHGKQINLDAISKQEVPQLLKHLFLEIRQTAKENKGKEYEPGTLQTCRNGLRWYFLERPCPSAVGNFDLENFSATEFEEVSTILSMKKKDLKQRGLGNKPNAAQSVETEDTGNMWSLGAISLQNPCSLLRLILWDNVTHLGMRGFKKNSMTVI